LEYRYFDAQELLRILAEITDQQPHIAGQPCQVVIQLGIRKKLPRRRRVVVQLCGSRSQIRTRVPQPVVKLIIRSQFSHLTFSRSDRRKSWLSHFPPLFSLRHTATDRRAASRLCPSARARPSPPR